VGCLDEGITKADLRKRFEVFGPVTNVSVHLREDGYVFLPVIYQFYQLLVFFF